MFNSSEFLFQLQSLNAMISVASLVFQVGAYHLLDFFLSPKKL